MARWSPAAKRGPHHAGGSRSRGGHWRDAWAEPWLPAVCLTAALATAQYGRRLRQARRILRVYRTWFSGHGATKFGTPEARVAPCGRCAGRAAKVVRLDQPSAIRSHVTSPFWLRRASARFQ